MYEAVTSFAAEALKGSDSVVRSAEREVPRRLGQSCEGFRTCPSTRQTVKREASSMSSGWGEGFSRPVNAFRGRPLPERGAPVGYAALIERYRLGVPLPSRLAAVAERHKPKSTDEWMLVTPRHRPESTLEAQLEFALKYEGVDLAVLHALFAAVEPEEIASLVRSTPTGIYARRAWFLYEWLTGRVLPLENAPKVRAVPAVDDTQQLAAPKGALSVRHRVIDNLPGTRRFCPMVRWTPALRKASSLRLDQRAREVIGRTHPDLVTRAAAFLLLSDSRSSFRIEGEQPSSSRALRWGEAISQAGRTRVTVAELERLQRIVIGDARFVRLGVRTEHGFVGSHDRVTREPIPEHISARPDDLDDLLTGLVDYDRLSHHSAADPVVAAAVLAFGFVYVHPFVDGNGRIHRWLIHHVLSKAEYSPPGLVFPVSAAILRNIDAYRRVLQSYSRPLLELVEWQPTETGNLEVLNQTAHLYRYFDATAHAEFLYRCVEETVAQDLPDEVRYLEQYDRFAAAVQNIVEMPATTLDLLHRFLESGGGRLSRRAREKEFASLTADEVARLEALYIEVRGAQEQEVREDDD